MSETEDDEFSPDERIRALMISSLGWHSLGLFDAIPFDTSKPNFHDSKSDFLHERDTIQEIVDNLRDVYLLSTCAEDDPDSQKQQTTARLKEVIEANEQRALGILSSDDASGLARRNLVETGFFHNFIALLLLKRHFYKQRLEELEDQEKQFWNVKSRPPNYFARTIALRFAKFYARQTGRKPTIGTSREGPHPSTDYGRILEEIFRILDIQGTIRGPATWAISQIVDDDLKPASSQLSKILGGGLFGAAGGLGSFPSPFPPIQEKKGSD